MKRIIIWLFFVVLIKAIVWSLIVPLWHTPDEQAHFGHVAFIAEGGELERHGRFPDMTEEIYTSLDILGTKRDEFGNNKFTFHPEYRLDYSSTLNGPREEEIKNLPQSSRNNFVIKESAYYPHFFYQLSGLVYKLVYPANLFVRVFSTRLFWIFAHLLTIWFIYKIARLVFPKNNLLIFSTTILAGFQPMLSFVSAGVTSDNLHNLLFTAVIYFCLKIILQPYWQDYLGLTIALGLGLVNKQQFFLAFLIIVPAVIYQGIKHPKKTLPYLAFFPFALAIAYFLAPERMSHLINLFLKGQIPYLVSQTSIIPARPDYSFTQHILWTLQHTVKEVLPWYWGVFNWLGVVLPRWVNQVLMRLLALAGLGLVVKTIKIIKNRKILPVDLSLIYLIWVAVSYFLGLMLWDFNHVKNVGFSFGFQGRYYFPVIASHLILLSAVIWELFLLFGKKAAQISIRLLSLLFIALGFIGLYTVAKAYYNVTDIHQFIIQASQYKPWFAKGWWLVSSLILYITGSLVLIWSLIKNEK